MSNNISSQSKHPIFKGKFKIINKINIEGQQYFISELTYNGFKKYKYLIDPNPNNKFVRHLIDINQECENSYKYEIGETYFLFGILQSEKVIEKNPFPILKVICNINWLVDCLINIQLQYNHIEFNTKCFNEELEEYKKILMENFFKQAENICSYLNRYKNTKIIYLPNLLKYIKLSHLFKNKIKSNNEYDLEDIADDIIFNLNNINKLLKQYNIKIINYFYLSDFLDDNSFVKFSDFISIDLPFFIVNFFDKVDNNVDIGDNNYNVVNYIDIEYNKRFLGIRI